MRGLRPMLADPATCRADSARAQPSAFNIGARLACFVLGAVVPRQRPRPAFQHDSRRLAAAATSVVQIGQWPCGTGAPASRPAIGAWALQTKVVLKG